MNTGIAFKNWPDITTIDTTLYNTLERLNLAQLDTDYQETKDGQDTWTIRDQKARQDLFCLIIDHNLELLAPTTINNPILDWLINEILHDLQDLPDTLTQEKHTSSTYFQWCMTQRSFGPTFEMAKTRFQQEKEMLKYPTLAPAYALYNGGQPLKFKE